MSLPTKKMRKRLKILLLIMLFSQFAQAMHSYDHAWVESDSVECLVCKHVNGQHAAIQAAPLLLCAVFQTEQPQNSITHHHFINDRLHRNKSPPLS